MKAIIICLVFLGLKSHGQEFSIININSQKKITNSDILDIYISKEYPLKNTCNYSKVTGNLISMVKDSFTIGVNNILVFSNNTPFQTQFECNWQKQDYKMTFSKGDIAMMKIIKSERKRKTKNALAITGGLLFIGGALTAINTVFFVEKGHRKNLLIASGVQSIAGFVIGLSSNYPRYQFKGSQDNWQFGN